MKVKVNDTVLVISGKERSKKGKITRVLSKQNKIVVEDINIRVRNVRKTSSRPGERIKFSAPIDASNVKLICPSCKKAVRVGYKVSGDNRKERVCKKCQATVDQKTNVKSSQKN